MLTVSLFHRTLRITFMIEVLSLNYGPKRGIRSQGIICPTTTKWVSEKGPQFPYPKNRVWTFSLILFSSLATHISKPLLYLVNCSTSKISVSDPSIHTSRPLILQLVLAIQLPCSCISPIPIVQSLSSSVSPSPSQDHYYQQLQLLHLILPQTSNSGLSQPAWIPFLNLNFWMMLEKHLMALTGSHFSFTALPSALHSFSSPSNALSHSYSGH